MQRWTEDVEEFDDDSYGRDCVRAFDRYTYLNLRKSELVETGTGWTGEGDDALTQGGHLL